MNPLQIEKKNALTAFNKADAKGKVLLEDLFGKEMFSNVKITDRIKTWEDACTEKGIDPETSLPFRRALNSFQEAANAFFMLDIIADVLLEGVVLDWSNENQKKWYCWFNNYQPGSGFSFYDSDCGWTAADASGGARLCFDTEEKAKYFGTQFLPLFSQFLTPNK